MGETKFLWLANSGEARNGKRLEHGQAYLVADFPAEVVAEWVRAGDAKLTAPAKKGGQEE